MPTTFEHLDERLVGFADRPPIDQVERLGDALDLAPQSGLVSALPFAEPTEAFEAGSEGARIRTIRNRLHRLGYLETDSEAAVLDQSYRTAVSAFQKDADLIRDGWVGDQTWGALQELVGFEDPMEVGRWYDSAKGKPCPALRRAVQLRLHAFGLAKHDPGGSRIAFPTLLKRFAEAAALLGLTESAEIEGRESQVLALLFDMDAITAKLAGATGFGEEFLSRAGNVRGAWRNAALLMANAAKIELWLAGYDVDMNNPEPVITKKLFSAGRKRSWRPNAQLEAAIARYWHNRAEAGEVAEPEAKTRATHTRQLLLIELPAFFQGVAEASAEYDQVPDSERSASIAEWYGSHPEQVETSVRHVDTLRSRLWDGVKRVWSWIKGLIRKVVDSIVKFARDIAAVAHGFATRTFRRMVDAVRAITETVKTVFARTLPGSDANEIVIARERDFDYRLFANRAGQSEEIRSIVEPLGVSAARFRVGCEFVGLLVQVVIRAVAVISTGGFALFFSLIDIFRSLGALRRRLRSVQPA